MYKIVRLITIERRIGNLNRDAEIVNVDITNHTQCNEYCLMVVATFNNAEANYNDGNREKAYVLFRRVLHIFERIQMTSQYQENKQHYDDIIVMSNITKTKERVKELSRSLKAKYSWRRIAHKILSGLLNRNGVAGVRRDLNERPANDPIQQRSIENYQFVQQDNNVLDGVEGRLPAAPLEDDVPNVELNMPSTTQVYFPQITPVLADPAGISRYTGLPSTVLSEENRLCLESTENGSQFKYYYTVVPNIGTDLDKGDVTVSCKMVTVKDMHDVRQDLAPLLNDYRADPDYPDYPDNPALEYLDYPDYPRPPDPD